MNESEAKMREFVISDPGTNVITKMQYSGKHQTLSKNLEKIWTDDRAYYTNLVKCYKTWQDILLSAKEVLTEKD